MSISSLRIYFLLCLVCFLLTSSITLAEKMDYMANPVHVTDSDWSGIWTGDKIEGLVDGIGTEPYPGSSCSWRRGDVPTDS